MQNVKISKIDKKRNKLLKFFFTKKTETILYLLDKCLKMKVHKQTFMYLLLCRSYYFKHIVSINKAKIRKTISIVTLTQKNCAYRKHIRHFLLYEYEQIL